MTPRLGAVREGPPGGGGWRGRLEGARKMACFCKNQSIHPSIYYIFRQKHIFVLKGVFFPEKKTPEAEPQSSGKLGFCQIYTNMLKSDKIWHTFTPKWQQHIQKCNFQKKLPPEAEPQSSGKLGFCQNINICHHNIIMFIPKQERWLARQERGLARHEGWLYIDLFMVVLIVLLFVWHILMNYVIVWPKRSHIWKHFHFPQNKKKSVNLERQICLCIHEFIGFCVY